MHSYFIEPTEPCWAATSDIEDPYAKGLELATEGKYAAAATSFAAAIKEDPTFILAYIKRARNLVLAGRRKESLRSVDLGIKVARKSSDRLKLLEQRRLLAEIFYTNKTFQLYQDGLNLVKGSKLPAAIEAFEKALAVEPDNLAVLLAYGKSLQGVDEWAQSIEVLEQTHKLDENRRSVRFNLGKALIHKNPERVAFLLKPLAQGEKNTEADCILYASALAKQGKISNAISVLRNSVGLQKERLESLYWLGRYYSQSPDGSWMARKYLMTFLRREKRLKQEADLRNLRLEAARLLDRINLDLGVEPLDG